MVLFCFQIVKQMPTMASSKQPTIAIITAQYCEKLAVDAMMENRETFVKYTTVGKFLSTPLVQSSFQSLIINVSFFLKKIIDFVFREFYF